MTHTPPFKHEVSWAWFEEYCTTLPLDVVDDTREKEQCSTTLKKIKVPAGSPVSLETLAAETQATKELQGGPDWIGRLLGEQSLFF